MSRRTTAWAALVVATLISGVPVTAVGATTSSVVVGGCRFARAAELPERPRLVAATRGSVAFSGATADGRAVFACRRGAAAHTLGLLDSCPLDCSGIRAIRLTDRYAAFEELEHGSRDATDFDAVRVVDLAGHQRALRADASGYSRVLGDPPYRAPLPGVVTDLAVTSTGGAVWISQDQGSSPPTFAVWLRARGRPAQRLDSGPGVQAGSLAVARGRVYWANATGASSAPAY